MSKGWEILTLRQAGVVLIDCVHKTPVSTPTGYAYVAIPQMSKGRIDFATARRISSSDFEIWTKKAKPQAWDVVLLRADGRFVHPPFLRWLTRSPQWWEQINKNLNVGAVFDSLKCADVPKFEMSIPPRPDQEAIAEVLGSLDDKVEQNRRAGRKLEGLARAVFKAWFVDFEPVKAKAAGATSFPGMPAATFAALPTRLVDSALGPVPEGWEIGTVGDAMTLSKQQISPQEHADELFEHFSIPAFDAGQNAVIEPGSAIKSQKFAVVPGCVLLSKLNPRIARVWLPSASSGRRQIASTEFLVTFPRPGWTREYLYCQFQQDDFRDALAQSASGTSNSHQRVRPNDLVNRPLVLPPKATLDAFAELVAPQMQLRAALLAESTKLATLRDYLLPWLLSGRLRTIRNPITFERTNGNATT